MHFSPALLEDWMRDYYFSTHLDLGSSGVECWSLADLRRILTITQPEIDGIVFQDSTSYGNTELRKAISLRWGNGDPERVMVTHGSSEAIYLTMNTLLNPGDEIIVVDPIYHALSSTAETLGCTIKRWTLSAEQGFQPEIEDLKALIGPRTRMIAVNFPHNPLGVSLTAGQQQQLIDAAASVGAYLVWDAAFTDLTYDEPPLPDPTMRYNRSISLGTFSKAYGLPGMRFGWCMADPEVLAHFLPLRDRLTLHLSPLIEFLALRVVYGAEDLLAPRLKQAKHNLALLTNWIATQRDYVEWKRPSTQGGVTIFPRLHTRSGVEALCRTLGNQHGVLLVPGICFGFPDRVRLGFGGSTVDFEQGLSILGDLLTMF